MNILPVALALAVPSLTWAQSASIPADIEENIVQYIQMADTLAPLLVAVTDKESAQTTAPLLQKHMGPLYELGEKFKLLTNLPPETSQLIEAQYAQKMREAWGRVYVEIFRLQKAQCFASIDFAKQLQALCNILTPN